MAGARELFDRIGARRTQLGLAIRVTVAATAAYAIATALHLLLPLWAVLTSLVMLVAWTIANGAPFFGDLVNLVGALTGAPLAFLAPPLFYLRGRRLSGSRPALSERALAAVMVLLASALTVMGTIGAIVGVVHGWQAYGRPFECHA